MHEDFPNVLRGYQIAILKPEVSVPTAEAYSWITPREDREDLRAIMQLPLPEWAGKLVNDFEAPVCDRYPQIKSLIDKLYKEGALYAAMSGSGAAVFGIFDKAVDVQVDGVSEWRGVI